MFCALCLFIRLDILRMSKKTLIPLWILKKENRPDMLFELCIPDVDHTNIDWSTCCTIKEYKTLQFHLFMTKFRLPKLFQDHSLANSKAVSKVCSVLLVGLLTESRTRQPRQAWIRPSFKELLPCSVVVVVVLAERLEQRVVQDSTSDLWFRVKSWYDCVW